MIHAPGLIQLASSRSPLIPLLVFLALTLVLNLPCAAARLPKSGIPDPGTYKQVTDIKVKIFSRSYLVHIPTGYSPDTPVPMVLVIHGAFNDAKGIERHTEFSLLADRENFIVVYPNGNGLFGMFQHWNAEFCCSKAMKEGIDDVGFLTHVVEEVSGRFAVDRSRIYIVGNSNGGMLTHLFAARRSDLVAAAAMVSATAGGHVEGRDEPWTPPLPEHPVPVMLLHGKTDDKVPYQGRTFEGDKGLRSFLSVPESARFWVEANGCAKSPDEEQLDRGMITRKTWSGGKDGSQVVLYGIEDWGHVWPGGRFTRKLKAGDPRWGFNAAEVIWEFFSRFRRE